MYVIFEYILLSVICHYTYLCFLQYDIINFLLIIRYMMTIMFYQYYMLLHYWISKVIYTKNEDLNFTLNLWRFMYFKLYFKHNCVYSFIWNYHNNIKNPCSLQTPPFNPDTSGPDNSGLYKFQTIRWALINEKYNL